MIFEPKSVNYQLSPYTGMTRESWIEAGKYLLTGIFRNIPSFDAPVVMPRQETKITYPHLDAPESDQAVQRRAEIFEGLTRSMFIAAPLIHIEPEITLCGYRLRDYYKSHILRVCTPSDPLSVGDYEEQLKLSGSRDTFRTFQQTVETCALVICLWVCREEIWDTYTREEKDTIARFLDSYARASTVPQNWRLFNMLDMAFLHMEGYPIDREIMMDHAQTILNYYAGDGWYRDGHSFDYYSCWAFNVYAPIWNLWYGYENAPYIAEQFEEHSNRLMDTYPDFFDREGFTNMWGRSNIYRFAAVSAFDGNFLLRHPSADPGLARRISSGSLLQFLQREDFLYNGVPTLGFYGQFGPLVQGYSCAESPFWMGKAFLCLHLPADHPFWTAQERNGTWETLGEKEVKVTTLDGPALCFSNHQANGSTILRTGKVVKNVGDRHGMWNYSKLSFHTKYPWEASPREASPRRVIPVEAFSRSASSAEVTSLEDASLKTSPKAATTPREDVESQQYVLRDGTEGSFSRANVTFWQGERGGVLYRRQFFDYTLSRECHWTQALNLADFTVPYGILRADKMRFHRRPVSMTLGAYGFPDHGTQILRRESGSAKALILKGHDGAGREKQLAMTIFDGWDSLDYLYSQGTNPDSERSVLVYASLSRQKQYDYDKYMMISQVITKESLEDFTEEELFPVAGIYYTDEEGCGGYGPVRIVLKDGRERVINFEGMEGQLQL